MSTPSAALSSSMTHSPGMRGQLIEFLKRRGETDIAAASASLGISQSGLRQHLTVLERDGLVAHRERRAGAGRPQYAYTLTPAGDALFPRNYDQLANELLNYVEDEDPAMLKRIFDRRAGRRLRRTQIRTEGMTFGERVEELARILDEDGYLAEVERRKDGTFLITENNCAVLSVALRHGHACSSELDYLRAALPEAEVTRVAHRIASGHVCAYEIRENV